MTSVFSVRSRRRAWQIGLLSLSVVLAGCTSVGRAPRSGSGAPFVPKNVVGDERLPGNLRRVVLLPLYGGTVAPGETTGDLDAVFATALQQQGRFEVVALTRDECLRRFRSEAFASTGELPRDLFTILRSEWGADAVIFVDVTAFEANRPLVLGVRAKLARLDDARLVWSFDTVFSAADPAVVAGAKHHASGARRGDRAVHPEAAIFQSPSRFGAYVATTSFATLPIR